MYLSAYVTCKNSGKKLLIEHEGYTSKKAFEQDIRANGYSITRISNRRDIAAQDAGYETFAAMKKDYEKRYSHDRDFYRSKFERLAEIEEIAL